MSQSEHIKSIPSDRLQFFPVMMFAVVMGFTGLSIVFYKMHEVLYFPSIIVDIFGYLSLALFVVILFFYIKKIFTYKEEVKKEFTHPIRVNFFAAISISMLLLAIFFRHSIPLLANGLFIAGALLHFFFTFYTIRFWINNNLEMQHSNPAWFIPIVGNILVPIAGKGFASETILYFYFSIGIFFWIVLFAIILNRIIFHKQFAPKFMPTLFILIAPPAIGFVAYISMTSTLDFFAHILYSLALFFTILVFVMYKNYIKIKFFISWWAFTFPMAAISIATILMYQLTHENLYLILSYVFMVITILVVLLVAKETIVHMLKKEICIME
ncbi:SLAC1 anion channel family protein [Halarcobacter anaerophilus]|uniref:C4-dicarboxylate ABC transporter n=1 Tax=Halarcobacter anaerophilus TaxID=877500 RepID=A0A4Q0Y7A3_9BACT|nr:SLAC1 anion channel family protein [Halarcobacter anaerophilus]QDF29123.1 tellurite-resistance/dicarboxylate transporter (TDT) family protein [Halarcobacter anaerophilus]RXJ64381.1 C4-dicarboxylate ABC transporter [Halarcobacter anaerophilus]